MADNTQLNPGSGGDVIKTEDLGQYKLAVSKIYLGAHGVDGGPVGTSNPLPVSVTNYPVAQAVTASTLPLPAGAATAAKQALPGAAGSSSTDVLSIQGIASMIPVSVTLTNNVGAPGFVRLSDGASPQGVQTNPIRTDPVGTTTQPVSGTVSVGNFPATQPVSGSVSVGNFPVTQAVSGSVSVGNFPATQAVSGSVSVGNFPATQAVSGSVSVGNFPATQAVSGTVSVSGTIATTANLTVSGSAVAAGNPVPVTTIGAIPAGTNLIGTVVSPIATGVLYNGTAALTPKFASISSSATGDNTIVAAVSGKKLRVLKYTIVASGLIAAKFRSSSGTDLTGPMTLGANSGVGGAFCPVGHFETIAGDALVLNLSAAVSVAGHLTYVEV
jgi:hypothetical protein